MFSNRVFIITVVALCGIANADVTKRGECPTNITAVADFHIKGYMGLWYEHPVYPHPLAENSRHKPTAYSLEADGRVRVTNSLIIKETRRFKDLVVYGTPVEKGKFVFVSPESEKKSVTTNYWVIDTDYKTYSAVYICQQLENKYESNLWILSREQYPENVIEKP